MSRGTEHLDARGSDQESESDSSIITNSSIYTTKTVENASSLTMLDLNGNHGCSISLTAPLYRGAIEDGSICAASFGICAQPLVHQMKVNNEEEGAKCLRAIRYRCKRKSTLLSFLQMMGDEFFGQFYIRDRRKRLAPILDSHTNLLDQDFEVFLFQELGNTRKSVDDMSEEFATCDKYDQGQVKWPILYRSQLSADDILRHIYWRLSQWDVFWSKAPKNHRERLTAQTSLENLAFHLHEFSTGEPECLRKEEIHDRRIQQSRQTDRKGRCIHGKAYLADDGLEPGHPVLSFTKKCFSGVRRAFLFCHPRVGADTFTLK